MVICSGRPSEIGEVLALWRQADAEPTVTDDEEALRSLLAHDRDALVVAHDGERIVGTLIVGWDGWRGAYYRLAVLPRFRRQGVASLLVSEGQRRLEARGARRIALFAVTGDPGAAAFWRAAGYEPQTDRLRFVRNLPAS
jgi:ribosomal protein S18 acetylase RimI-like enzyme